MFSLFPPAPKKAILTPCIGVCELDMQGLCVGCHRNADEITRWSEMNDDERLRLMNFVLPQREHKRP